MIETGEWNYVAGFEDEKGLYQQSFNTSISDVVAKLLDTFYEEQEEVLLAILAAGVSVDEMHLTAPSLVKDEESTFLQGAVNFNKSPIG